MFPPSSASCAHHSPTSGQHVPSSHDASSQLHTVLLLSLQPRWKHEYSVGSNPCAASCALRSARLHASLSGVRSPDAPLSPPGEPRPQSGREEKGEGGWVVGRGQRTVCGRGCVQRARTRGRVCGWGSNSRACGRPSMRTLAPCRGRSASCSRHSSRRMRRTRQRSCSGRTPRTGRRRPRTCLAAAAASGAREAVRTRRVGQHRRTRRAI